MPLMRSLLLAARAAGLGNRPGVIEGAVAQTLAHADGVSLCSSLRASKRARAHGGGGGGVSPAAILRAHSAAHGLVRRPRFRLTGKLIETVRGFPGVGLVAVLGPQAARD